jgi:hypothetical protein
MEEFWSPLQRVIKEFCFEFDKVWQVRKRVITTHFLLLFIFKLVLSKNHQGYKSLINELWEYSELSAVQKAPISSSSLCEARQKLPEELFLELNKVILSAQEGMTPLPLWCGHRVFAGDGSKINLPHELLSEGYQAPNKDQYYPQGTLNTLYHLGSGLIYDCLLSADRNERNCLISQMNNLSAEDVLVLDRGYFSYLVLYKALEKGIHLICRLQNGSMNEKVKEFFESDLTNTIIAYEASDSVKSQIKKQGYVLEYRPIQLRLIKYKIADETYVCATTLIGDRYPLEEFAPVYHGRWGIEELYKISKEFIEIEDFHSKSERGVKQELYAHALLITIARLFELEANKQLPPPPGNGKSEKEKEVEIKESYWQDFIGKIENWKVNFKNCLLVISRFIEKLVLSTEEEKGSWLSKMLTSISRVRQKIRRGRHVPRCSRKPRDKWVSSHVKKVAEA